MNLQRVTSLAVQFLLGLSLVVAIGEAGAQQTPLRMALIPYLSPNILVPLFQPLARHFEADMGRHGPPRRAVHRTHDSFAP